jgi:hypothetical protein
MWLEVLAIVRTTASPEPPALSPPEQAPATMAVATARTSITAGFRVVIDLMADPTFVWVKTDAKDALPQAHRG